LFGELLIAVVDGKVYAKDPVYSVGVRNPRRKGGSWYQVSLRS